MPPFGSGPSLRRSGPGGIECSYILIPPRHRAVGHLWAASSAHGIGLVADLV